MLTTKQFELLELYYLDDVKQWLYQYGNTARQVEEYVAAQKVNEGQAGWTQIILNFADTCELIDSNGNPTWDWYNR